MWSTPAQSHRKSGISDNSMVTNPTDTTWLGLLSDPNWRSLSGLPSGYSSPRMGQAEIRQVRQIVSMLFGSDARIFIRERLSGEGAVTIHIMVQCLRTMPDRLIAQKALIDRLQAPLNGLRTRVLLTDPSFELTEQHKRFRLVAMEY
jgi:hypothetical protein